MSFNSIEEITKKGIEEGKLFWEVVVDDDMNERQVTKEEVFSKMKMLYKTMMEAIADYEEGRISSSKLVGGQGAVFEKALQEGKLIGGDFVGKVVTKALKMGESNACMKRIVAAPTAGACGVLPAVLLTYHEMKEVAMERMIEAMFVAGGIGQVIGKRAFLAGAAGGCQAEIGSASAMAAGALAYLSGGDYTEISSAVAFALKNLMGLVCDPIAGLVEVPCVKRNVIGAVNAITSADMAIAGIETIIPVDQVIDAMKAVGDSMPSTLRETGEGGIAATPKGIQIKQEVFG